MKTNEILEALLILVNEEIDRSLNEDKALKMSDERRAKFKKTVFSNPPANNSVGSLKEAPVPPPDAEEPDPMAADPATDLGGDPAAGMDPGAAADPMAAGGAPEGMEGGDLGGTGDPAMGEEDPMDDGGGDLGGGGDAGMGGFGGGGGGGMDLGGEGEEGMGGEEGGEPPPEPTSFDPFKDSKTLEDRLQVILDTAEAIAEQTQDPQKVLKAVKGMIQNGFENPGVAAKAISDLFGTDNPVLQQVSRRLALFTWGV